MKDKIIFWINFFLLYFYVAISIQKKLDVELYAIIDIANRPKKFFKRQKFVDFKKSWFYFDHVTNFNDKPDMNYLENFEKKYKIPLWRLAINERMFYRFNRLYKFQTNEILSILEKECKFYEKVLDDVKPDFMITYDPPLHNQKLFYDLCVAKGIKVLGLYITKVGNRCIIAQNGKTLDLDKTLEGIKSQNRNLEEIKKLLSSSGYSDIIKNYLKGRENTRIDKLRAVTEYVFKSDNSNIKTHYSYYGRTKSKVLIDAIKFSIGKKNRKNFMDHNLKTDVNLKTPFIYMPLAVDEESNLLNYAPFYTNQIEVIRHIIKSMPIKYKLYVKEHPGEEVRGWRNISEYKEILDIPNVTLIHPSVPSEKLFRNCSLVITIRGTTGLDAAFYGKPSVIFGDLSYSLLPSVFKVDALEELPNIIRKAVTKSADVHDLDKYITLIQENSFAFDLLGFEIINSQYFYAGGILSDVEISEEKMEKFLNKYQSTMDNLANRYIEKINRQSKD